MKGDYVTQLHHPIQDQRFGIRARTNQHNLMSGYVKDSIDHCTERTVAATIRVASTGRLRINVAHIRQTGTLLQVTVSPRVASCRQQSYDQEA